MTPAEASRPETRKARPVAAGRTSSLLRLTSDNPTNITALLRAQFVAARLNVTPHRAALLAALAFPVSA